MDPGSEPSLHQMVEAVDGLARTDEDWTDLQWHLADAFHDRYFETLDPTDLGEAIERGRSVVQAQEEQSAEHLLDLSLMLWTRIEDAPESADVEEYIRLNERALALVAAHSASAHLLATCQANLATGLMTRGGFEPHPSDRERAIRLWEAAVASPTMDADVRAGIHANLAQALSAGDASSKDLLAAVEHGRRAVTIGAQASDADAEQLHFALANALTALSERSAETGLVQEAISHIRKGLDGLGREHPEYAGFSVNLVSALRTRARQSGELAQLEEAEAIVRNVILPRILPGHPDRALALTTSAGILSELASWREADSMHAEAISLYREAVKSAEPASHERGVALVGLASSSRDASERLDDAGLLDSGVAAAVSALAIFATPSLHRAAALTAAGNLLRDRFINTGDLRDLDRAIEFAEEALRLTPTDHQEHPARQTNLAVLLSDDYTERAARPQLDRAIGLYREALAAWEPAVAREAERRSDISLALRDRHKDSGSIADLDEAVDHAAASATATFGSISWLWYANNYANALAERFEVTQDLDDLEQAVQIFRDVNNAAKGRATDLSGYATNLGLALATRAQHLHRYPDLEEAVEHLQRSVRLLAEDHPDRSIRTANLADVMRQKSEALMRRGDSAPALDLARTAVEIGEQAERSAGRSEARLLPALANLARAMRWLHKLDPARVTVGEILEVQRRAAQLRDVSPAERFAQSALWAQAASRAGDSEQQFAAYQQAVSLTGDVAWIGLTEAERLQLLTMMSDVLVSGVGFAISAGLVWTGLAWADQIRAVMARQNTVSKSLSGSDSLAGSLVTTGRSLAGDQDGEQHAREHRRRTAHRHAEKLHLKTPEPDAYRSLRFPGYVVLLVPSPEGSLAVVIDGSTGADSVVRLSRATQARLARQVDMFRATCRAFYESASVTSLEHETQARHQVFDCLEWLWESVVEPVLRDLPTSQQRPRVWWSPVGDFALLPVHAAGVHPRKATGWPLGPPGALPHSAPDMIVSSYLPTVMQIAPSQHDPGHDQSPTHRLLYVGTDTSHGSLPQAEAELSAVQSALERVPIDTLLNGAASGAAIRGQIASHTFLHVAAHGFASTSDSPRTGFRLSNGVFTVTDLADCNVRNGQLAVFLTCDAAAGDTQSPNEALHLAGAAQQAGYPDIVAATMPLRDEPTVTAAELLYGAVNEDPAGISDRIAETLAVTVDRLRRDVDVGPDPLAWAPYAHFGWGLASPPWEAAGQ